MPHPALQYFLNRLLIRSPLTEEERQAILSMRFHLAQVSPNVDIVPPGHLVTYSCLVAEGLAGRFGQLPNGMRQITAMYIPGDMCDLHSAMLPRVEWAVQALSAPLTYLKIPHEELLRVSRAHPRVAEAFWRDCVVDASIIAQWVVSLGRRDAAARTAHLLCEMALRLECAGQGSRTAFEFKATQAHIADALGITPVHMNRVVRWLRQQGVLSWTGRTIRVLDWDGLVRIASFDGGYLEMRRE
ncbi:MULTISPECIES: Crp/Fnr family transcriptional regulator [Sphingobium]|uniref:Crp/Fnr family transcriptional regulator n=1 Tax=Sphingobium fuliginis (strain ATCC 27551) TaxID=336203 RepID=A0ABQ1EPW3_SPHSA|nr:MULTISPECIES: Crp/Fnr family transcriptional regulator [Sphingobium]AJR25961.1 Crp/Fnr family transcriptional regulator [Sphingobium sp. YBL2]RYM00683.1 Crp/Fnr family transcriptional regulator [Sphingobium fuliginis]UXC89271.1 Crp/Fnr family transcriptional regulator [Sphingobium sp. RSMS]WDA38161.1 Crp/Fnr family transcriptional regulator [Sphingobium sp. YC-XJ3]GFZ81390.1 Crp/Fnr family transcriptional regulator [Sphingobium fuliginis]